jgi:hypothetical protein
MAPPPLAISLAATVVRALTSTAGPICGLRVDRKATKGLVLSTKKNLQFTGNERMLFRGRSLIS